jgi:nicotinate-nucleotide adenylyltransferase
VTHQAGPLAYFGGTFDPIHYGHLRTAHELLEILQVQRIEFLPSGQPPHRQRIYATAQARLNMVRAAIAEESRFAVDERECRRLTPSYTVDTLTELRQEWPQRSICLLIGMDAFLSLPQWHRYAELLQLAHIVVAHRPGWQAPQDGLLGQWVNAYATGKVSDLHEKMAGHIYIHEVTQLEISSSAVRELIAAGRDPKYLVPPAVRDFVLKNRCYFDKETPQG